MEKKKYNLLVQKVSEIASIEPEVATEIIELIKADLLEEIVKVFSVQSAPRRFRNEIVRVGNAPTARAEVQRQGRRGGMISINVSGKRAGPVVEVEEKLTKKSIITVGSGQTGGTGPDEKVK